MRIRATVRLDREDLQALRGEARRLGISLSEVIRGAAHDYLNLSRLFRPAPVPKEVFLRIVGLGSSGASDEAERHDHYVGEARRREHAC